MKSIKVIEVYNVSTDCSRSFWVLATSPGRAISKLKRKRKSLLDRGEKITDVTLAGTVDVF